MRALEVQLLTRLGHFSTAQITSVREPARFGSRLGGGCPYSLPVTVAFRRRSSIRTYRSSDSLGVRPTSNSRLPSSCTVPMTTVWPTVPSSDDEGSSRAMG
jgi:hypothetical protein